MAMRFTGVDLEEEVIEQAKIICAKERITLKELHHRIFVDYIKKHGDGNPNFTLDQFDHDEMKAVPAMFRRNEDWMVYVNGLNEKDFRELETKVYSLKSICDKKWEKGFD